MQKFLIREMSDHFPRTVVFPALSDLCHTLPLCCMDDLTHNLGDQTSNGENEYYTYVCVHAYMHRHINI